MLQLPKSTEYNKRIPKQKFYENLPVTPAIKRVFVEQIRTIIWRNKIAAITMNLAEGDAVKELEVFEIQLNSPVLDESVLKQMDQVIPYHILFLLTFEDKVQAWIGYKEAAQSGTNAFKVSGYYHTDWLKEADMQLRIEGLSTDAVYENLVRQIAGDELQTQNGDTLQETVERTKQRADIEKKIAALEAKIRKEKQLNRQMELNAEVKKLRKELETV
ncbi:MAG: DUF4391 domain-containing protein [Clostridia bacterium]|nr:DUF4391 domain-containing protein [Clostridia bacterium]